MMKTEIENLSCPLKVELSRDHMRAFVLDAESMSVAEVRKPGASAKTIAEIANLFAAAPELLAALELAKIQFDFIASALHRKNTISISSVQNCAAACNAAIAKATNPQT